MSGNPAWMYRWMLQSLATFVLSKILHYFTFPAHFLNLKKIFHRIIICPWFQRLFFSKFSPIMSKIMFKKLRFHFSFQSITEDIEMAPLKNFCLIFWKCLKVDYKKILENGNFFQIYFHNNLLLQDCYNIFLVKIFFMKITNWMQQNILLTFYGNPNFYKFQVSLLGLLAKIKV